VHCEFMISAVMMDYFEHVELITSEKDYESYNSRFPKFLPSSNLHDTRVAFNRYRASVVYCFFCMIKCKLQ